MLAPTTKIISSLSIKASQVTVPCHNSQTIMTAPTSFAITSSFLGSHRVPTPLTLKRPVMAALTSLKIGVATHSAGRDFSAEPPHPLALALARARATCRPHDGTARCRRHHAVPPTAEPPPRCSLPAARRPASLSLPCDDFHTALATLVHRRRLPHAVAQHYAVLPLSVRPPCSHYCAQARQPRCLVTRIVNSAVISATPRCTTTPGSCPASSPASTVPRLAAHTRLHPPPRPIKCSAELSSPPRHPVLTVTEVPRSAS